MTADGRSDASPLCLDWLRAVASGLGIALSLVILLVWVPELILTKLTGLERSTRVTIATTWFFVALGLAAWTLRRLQARRLI